MAVKKHRTGYFIGLVFLVILVGIIIWICYCISLAFHDDYKDKYSITETDDTLIISLIKASAFGKEVDLTESQINTYINQKICSENGKIKNAVIYLHESEPSELYAKIELFGYDFGFYSKVSVNLDTSTDILYAIFSGAKLGRLDIPDKILAKSLSEVLKDKDNITVDGTTISIKSSYQYDMKSTDISITLEEFTCHEGYTTCRTNNLSLEALNALKEYIKSEEGQEQLKEIFSLDNIKENISSWLKKYQ